jgi:hypothetical protein
MERSEIRGRSGGPALREVLAAVVPANAGTHTTGSLYLRCNAVAQQSALANDRLVVMGPRVRGDDGGVCGELCERAGKPGVAQSVSPYSSLYPYCCALPVAP